MEQTGGVANYEGAPRDSTISRVGAGGAHTKIETPRAAAASRRGMLLLACCIAAAGCNSSDPTSPEFTLEEARKIAHGFWRVVDGDIEIPTGPAIVVYRWYSFDTAAHPDTVVITWDDGTACSISKALFTDSNVLAFTEQRVDLVFRFMPDTTATADYVVHSSTGEEHTYHRVLARERIDPRVACF